MSRFGGSFLGFVCVVQMLAGCAGKNPLDRHEDEIGRGRMALHSVDRHVGELRSESVGRTPSETVGDAERALADRLDELNALGPATGSRRMGRDAGASLYGPADDIVEVDRSRAIGSALTRNLAIGAVRLEPRLRAEEIIAAEAAFDVVLFGGVGYQRTDGSPFPADVAFGMPASETWRFGTGLRKRFDTGASAELSTSLDRFRLRDNSFSFSPDPAYSAAVRLGLTQPLLRGFGTYVNRAAIRLAENRQRAARAGVRGELEELAKRTEEIYWSLAQAWHDLAVSEWLVESGIEVRDVLERRREFDTRPAEFADAVARVEQRRADVIRAQFQVRQLSDQLKVLMNDPELPIGSETLIRPEELVAAGEVTLNLRDLMTQAIEGRSEIEQARIDILDASIRLGVAENQRLPSLNLRAEVAYFGVDDGVGGAYDNAISLDNADYLLELAFEYPLGNREADARERLTRLARTQSMIRYRNVVQNVVAEVKSAARLLLTSVDLLQATRSFRVAQSENLRALLVREEKIDGLTPEFLNLKFQRQEQLAVARRQEFAAIADYQRAVAGLDRAVGTLLRSRGFDLDAMTDLPVRGDLSGRDERAAGAHRDGIGR